MLLLVALLMIKRLWHSYVLALETVGLGIAPSDASATAKAVAHVVTDSKGGYGVLLETVNKLIAGKWRFPKQ